MTTRTYLAPLLWAGLCLMAPANPRAMLNTTQPAKPTRADTAGFHAPPKDPIPWTQLGARASAEYRGEGLTVSSVADGARLHCAFQRLQGDATREGLWLTSLTEDAKQDRFCVVATAIGRRSPAEVAGAEHAPAGLIALAAAGAVAVESNAVRFIRPRLVEEYSVSVDGVRQDFIIEQPPGKKAPASDEARTGELTVRLAVSGARVEALPAGAQLVLENSGRRVAYTRLHVTDATGRELAARVQVPPGGGLGKEMLVLVDDARAAYPVRIDPTFSDANWSSMNPSIPGVASGEVSALAVDGAGNLYVGGDQLMRVAGDVAVNGIAMWNGSRWSALGSGVNPGADVRALAVSGTDLYVGGSFTNAGGREAFRIAKWDGRQWSALGSGMDFPVLALAVEGNRVYAAGTFSSAGGTPADYVAVWDGSTWSALGSGMDHLVRALAVSDGILYAGGDFTTAGGIAATNVAKWDGQSWSALGSGIGGGFFGGVYKGVNVLLVSGGVLYVGGGFTNAAGMPANGIAAWDGSNWSVLGSGMDRPVYALSMFNGQLYAAGFFTRAGGAAAAGIAKWDGTAWSTPGSGFQLFLGNSVDGGEGYALVVAGGRLYAGGLFDKAGGVAALNVAGWDGQSWSALAAAATGISGYVNALAVSGTNVFAGGAFSSVGTNTTPGIGVIKWDGSQWSVLGSGMDNEVFALTVAGTNLYAGGNFTKVGGISARHVARWDGNTWSPLGPGLDRGVSALLNVGTTLYAGGGFTMAGTLPVNYIAKWNGSSWSPLGSGMDNTVWTLVPSGTTVYAGGYFLTAGGLTVNHVARWNGSSWAALGTGVDGRVNALAVSGATVYAGGGFFHAGGVPATNVAKWTGTSWTALGSGIPQMEVDALALSGTNLYVGGMFGMAGGVPVNGIARWDGASWSALGSGVGGSGYIYTPTTVLAMSGSDLYVGGPFSIAGGKPSPYLARVYLNLLPALTVKPSDATPGQITVSWPSADTVGFILEQGVSLAPSSAWATSGGSVADDGLTKSVTLPATDGPQIFRLRRP